MTKKAEEILNRELPVLPLYVHARAYLIRPFVRGVPARASGAQFFKYVTFADGWEKQPSR